jgi:tetratricopeptide (TPR) repeat protein
MAVAIAGLVASACKDTEHAPVEQPRPLAVELPPEAPAPKQAPQKEAPPQEPIATLEELRRLYDEAEGNPARLGPLKAKLDRFLAEHPDQPGALALLAHVQLEQGKLDESLTTAERCVTVSAEMAACWLTIGVISEISGSKGRAIEGYRRYLELAPDARYAPPARKALARLGAATAAPDTVEASTKLDVFGSIDATSVKATIEGRIESLQRCYETALVTRPELVGRIRYTVQILATGRVTGVAIDDDTLGDTKVAACTKAKIMGWQLPASEDGGEASFTVAFAPD